MPTKKTTPTSDDTTGPVIHEPIAKLAVSVDEVHPYKRNARQGDVDAIADSLTRNGQYRPIVVNKATGEILAGNHTYAAARQLGWSHIAATFVDVDEDQAARIVLADNRTADLGGYDEKALLDLLQGLDDDLTGTGYDDDDLEELLDAVNDALGGEGDGDGSGDLWDGEVANLSEQFGAPPMTVLNARSGEWQARKKEWLATGLSSGEGRADDLLEMSPHIFYFNWYKVLNDASKEAGRKLGTKELLASPHAARLKEIGGTSIFDPVLAELLTRWYSATGDEVTDPWAGGSVRAFVTSVLGRNYTGHELRQEQIDANVAQLERILPTGDTAAGGPASTPRWVAGDSRATLAEREAGSADFVIGCPPYYDLEEYGGGEGDLSALDTDAFDRAMGDTVAECARVLRDDRFAVFVVGSVRDKRGNLRSMHRLMVDAAERAGLAFVQDAILVTVVGSRAVGAPRAFRGGRSLGRVHQDVLIFCKGDRKKAAARLGDVDATASLEQLEQLEAAAVEDDDAEGDAE